MVDIAAKQRHVLLLKKVRNNQPLTAAEMRELKGYEDLGRTKLTAKKKVKKTSAARTPGKGDARAVFLGKLDELIAQAVMPEARASLEGLKDFVAGSTTTAMPQRAVAELLGEKPARMDYWVNRLGAPRNYDKTIHLKQFLAWWREWLIEQYRFDPFRVKLVDLGPFLGVSRQTINEWLKDGLPRNADKTFSLPAVFDWRVKQLGGKPADKTAAANPLHEIKAEKYRMEIEAARGRLVDRAAVEMGLAARAGVLVNLIDRKGSELPQLLANLTAENIKPVLDEFFGALRQAAATVPEDIAAVLPPGRREKLAAFLEELALTMEE